MRGKSHVFLWSILFLLCFFSAALAENGNLLKNSSFDQLDSQGLPADWYTEAWYTSEGYTTYSVETEEDGGKIAMIHNIGENDARFAQQVQVEPNTVYRLSGRIRASDIPDAGWGANLSVAGLYSRTDGLYDTGDDWVDVSLYGQTGKDQTSVTVYARLGGYSGESKGYAWFTDLRLEKVDRVPSDVLVDLWFTLPASGMDDFSDDDEGDFAEDSVSSAAWPYLIALGVLYSLCLLAFAAASRQSGKDLPASGKKSLSWPVFLGLAGSLFLHLFLSGRISGYEVDINCFRSWGATMAAVGPARFYASAGFCDYPPAYMLVLGLNQLILSGLKSLFGGVLPAWLPDTVILKLFPSLCDLFTAWLVYRWACENRMRPGQAGILCLLVAFHPLLILNSACWGQIDSVLMVLLLLVVRRALQKRWDWVFPLYILAVLVKPQALMVGPLGLIALIIALRQGDHLLRKRVFTGILVSLITAVAIILPFGIRQSPGWLLELYGKTLSSYAYASVNAANLYYLFGLNWVSVDRESSFPVCLVLILFSLAWAGMTILKGRKHPETPVCLPWLEPTLMGVFSLFFLICALARLSWSVCGYGAMALVFAILIPRFVRGKLQDLPFLCGLLLLLLYALGIKMHERYMFPAVGLLFLAWLIRQDRRILFLLAVLTPVLVVNEGIVLDNSIRLGAEYGHLNLDTEGLARFLSAVLLLASGFGLYIASGLELSPETRHRLQTLQNRLHLQNDPDLDPAAYTTSASLNWKRADTFLVLGITLAYSVLCFLNLGSTKAPQNPWMSTSTDESVILDLGQRHEDFSMLYYCQVSYNDFQVDVSDDLVHWTSYPAEMKEGLCFRWLYLKPTWTSDGQTVYVPASSYSSVQKLSGRYIRIRPDQIGLKLNEVLFRETETLQDADGQLRMVSGKTIPYNILEQTGAVKDSPLYSSAEALHDEQDTLEGEPGWFNGTYFDEIYHARTAYEHLHHQYPYETTHPPLGKVIMSWFIAIFGMTPFGWRFAGALAGILMLPVIYVFGKQLTGKTISGALPCGLLALDCMHLTQTRICSASCAWIWSRKRKAVCTGSSS